MSEAADLFGVGKDMYGQDLGKRVMLPGSLIGVYPAGTVPPPDTTKPPAEALKSTDEETYGLDIRVGVMESDEKFPGPVYSWHVHHYFDNKSPEAIKEAMELRYEVIKLFPNLSVNKFWRYAPELGGKGKEAPVGQFELELHTPQQLATYLPWVTANHGTLNIMLHPNKGPKAAVGHQSMFSDHTTDNYLMGKRELNPEIQQRLEGFFQVFRKDEDRPPTSPYAVPDFGIPRGPFDASKM